VGRAEGEKMKEYIVHVPKHLETNKEKIVSFFGEPIIELIRCKDCRWFINKECAIYCLSSAHEEAFCSYAEPKETS